MRRAAACHRGISAFWMVAPELVHLWVLLRGGLEREIGELVIFSVNSWAHGSMT
jgi:hypothetical protein